MNKTYAKAISAHNDAIHEFTIVRDLYRLRQVGDAEFIAAKQKYDAATKLFDAAYDAEFTRTGGAYGTD